MVNNKPTPFDNLLESLDKWFLKVIGIFIITAAVPSMLVQEDESYYGYYGILILLGSIILILALVKLIIYIKKLHTTEAKQPCQPN